MSTRIAIPASLFDPTGHDDIPERLTAWIGNRNNVPDGATAAMPPGTYRCEDAVVLGNRKDVTLDTNGAEFVQRTKRPFVVLADASNGNKNPAGKWNIVYTPTGTIRQTYDGRLNGSNAVDRATKKCSDLNRSRSFFKLNKCARVRLRGLHVTGMAGTDPYFDPNFEAANAVGLYGCTDTEFDDFDYRELFGNGVECNAYVESDGTYVPTRGLWAHDGSITDCGRQAASLSYGGNFIFERCDLAGSRNGRALIDMEPTTDRNPPGQEATVEGVYVVKGRIGKHRLGMIAAGLTRGDVRRIYAGGNVGWGIGTSGTMFAREVIYEDNRDIGKDSTPNAYKFAMGPQWGARSVIVRRNSNPLVSEAGVKFHDGQGNGGVENYSVSGNDFGGRPQFVDRNVPPWTGTFVPFALPIPSHALRDLN